MNMRKYLVVVEKAGGNYSAYLPDVPGCVTTGDTPEETLNNMREALELHLQDIPDGEVPEPTTSADYVTI
jgi:predicted RNase H-like HicB family nuclease